MTHILLTGAAGMAATQLRPLLRAAGHSLTLLDIAPVGTLHEGERFVRGSFTEPEVLDDALIDIDTVVHLGGHSRESSWSEILAVNIDGTQRILEAAHRAGVERALLASSTHAIGFWPVGSPDSELTPRPDTYYGVSKIAAEALGSVYADRYGMTVVAARIGTLADEPLTERHRHTWLSYPDLARLIEAVTTTPERGYHLVYAVSANTHGWFPLAGGAVIGYHPRDDAEAWAPFPPEDTNGPDLIGGAFADDAHPLGGSW